MNSNGSFLSKWFFFFCSSINIDSTERDSRCTYTHELRTYVRSYVILGTKRNGTVNLCVCCEWIKQTSITRVHTECSPENFVIRRAEFRSFFDSPFFFIIDGMKLEKKKRTNFIYYIASVYRSMAHFLWSTKHSHAYALPYSWRWSVCARAFTLPINNINFWSTFLLTSLARNTHWSAESNADARSISEFCIRNSVIGAALLECSSQNSKNASEIA